MGTKDHTGLRIIENGKDVSRRAGTWAEFMARVTAAAAKKPPRPKRPAPKHPPPVNKIMPPPEDRRCAFIHSKGHRKGRRCGQWAMNGGTRCWAHGGYRETPENPATIRRLDRILVLDRRHRINATYSQADKKLVRLVRKVLRERGIPLRPETVLLGVAALEADDGGRAWRRFEQAMQRAKPSEEMRARRKMPTQRNT